MPARPRSKVVRAEWRLPGAIEFVAALSAGTARTAALIAAQEPSALPAIINDIAGQAERFRRNDHLAVPMTAVLAQGRKSRMTTIDSCETRTA